MTKSPANVGKCVNRTNKIPLFSYSKEAKKYSDSTFTLPVNKLKSLISKVYINHFRPSNILSSITTQFMAKTISGFNLKFETQGEYYVQVFTKQKAKIHVSVLDSVSNNWLGGIVGVKDTWCKFELGGTVEDRNHTEAQLFVSFNLFLTHFRSDAILR